MKTRRDFIRSLVITLAAIPFARSIFSGGAVAPAAAAKEAPLPAGLAPASEADPVAAAIGYKADVKNIDFKKYPQRKKKDAQKQFCENCALYTKSNEGWGKCQMIANGVVAAKGWCGSWSAKS